MTEQTLTEQTLGNAASSDPMGRSATVRRLYLYLIAFFSLIVGLSATRGLINTFAAAWFAGDTLLDANAQGFLRDAIARQGGFLIVATPIFLIHWRYIRRLAAQPAEAAAALRKLFLYAALAVTTFTSARALYLIIQASLAVLLRTPWAEGDLGSGQWVAQFFHAGIHLALFFYFARLLRRDGDLGAELGWAGSWRRLFQLLLGLIALALLITGAADLLNFLWRALLESLGRVSLAAVNVGWWQRGLAGSLAALLVGALLWRLNNLYWNGLINAQPSEGRMALRRLYLYLSTVLVAVLTLVSAATLLKLGVLFLVGGRAAGAVDSDDISIADFTSALSYLPVGALAWRWHWMQVSAEALRYGDSRESVFVRRLYYYAVAAAGLVLLWIGLVDLVRALLDFALMGVGAVENAFRAHQLATGVSLIVVGAPVWSLHWRAAQRAAMQDNETGRAERASWPRRVYLYGIAAIGALLILSELARVIYRLLLWLLGDPGAGFLAVETLDGLARAGTAAAFWAVHLLAIRSDNRMVDKRADAPPHDPKHTARRREELLGCIATLETTLSAARAELAELEELSDEQ